MTFADSVARLAPVSHSDHLRPLLAWLKGGHPFCHLRINDGEIQAMLHLRTPDQVNNCGHHYYIDLGQALVRVIDEVRAAVQADPAARIRVGSYWFTQGDRIEGLDHEAQALVGWATRFGLLDTLPWTSSDALVRSLPEQLPDDEPPLTLQCFDVVREQAKAGKPVVLVGNPRIEPAKHCLGAYFVAIPRYDCWLATEELHEQVHPYAAAGATFVWCCGLAKPWIWDTWTAHPHTSHLDAGHLFDGVVGEYSRAWLRRQDPGEPLWQSFRNVFVPYVGGFVP